MDQTCLSQWLLYSQPFLSNMALPVCEERPYYEYFPGGAEVKAFACNVGDLGSIPGLGRSPGEGNGNPLQYSCLENPMDGGAWWATVHGSQRVGHDWATSLSLSDSVFYAYLEPEEDTRPREANLIGCLVTCAVDWCCQTKPTKQKLKPNQNQLRPQAWH